MVNSLLKSSTSMVLVALEKRRSPLSPLLPYGEVMSSQSTENEDWYGFFSFGAGSGTSLMSSTSSKKYSYSKPSCRDSTSSHGIAIVSFTIIRWSTNSFFYL
jgi:hypothetical protein